MFGVTHVYCEHKHFETKVVRPAAVVGAGDDKAVVRHGGKHVQNRHIELRFLGFQPRRPLFLFRSLHQTEEKGGSRRPASDSVPLM